MKNPAGFALAVAATASLAIAGGDDEKKTTNDPNKKTLNGLASSPAQGGSPTVSAKPGSGVTIDLGDDFAVTVANRVQVKWQFAHMDTAADVNNFSIKAARTKLSGHVFEKTNRYYVQTDWTRTPVLLDAWFDWGFYNKDDNSIALRVGAQKPHYGREFTGTSGKLEFIDRSIASRSHTGSRVTGAYVHGDHIEGKKLHWWAGAVNSDPAGDSVAAERGTNGSNVDNELNFIFNVGFDPMGDFGDENYEQGDLAHSEDAKGTVGASLLVGNHRDAANTMDIETVGINIYTAWKYRGVHVLGEVFLRSDDPDVTGGQETDSTGFAIGGSYTTPEDQQTGRQYAFAVRYSQASNDDPNQVLLSRGNANPLGAAEGETRELEAAVSAYYHGHKLKTQLGYRHQTVDPNAGTSLDNDFIELLFTWNF